MPRGAEEVARAFHAGLLGLTELPKPPVLAARGGCWFTSGAAVLHLGVEEPFSPARKAHPAFLTEDTGRLQAALTPPGHERVRTGGGIPGLPPFPTPGPFGHPAGLPRATEFQQATGPSSGS